MKRLLLLPLLLLASLAARPSQSGFSVVEGIVTAAGTGLPVAGARAVLAKEGELTEKISLTATAGTDGRFVIKDVRPGRYRLFVGHSAYVLAEFGQPFLDKPGTPLDIGPDEAIRIPFTLTRIATIKGKVRNQFGTPVSGFVVRALKAGYENGERVLEASYYTTTDSGGEFQIFDVTPGWYFLSASPAQDYSAQELAAGVVNWPAFFGGQTEAEASPVRIGAGEEFDAGTLTILRAAAAHVRGQLIDAATGKPEADARILVGRKLRNDVALSGQSAPVRRTGEFDLAAVPPGTYRLDVVTSTTAGSATVEVAGTDINGLKILLYPRATLSGRLTVEGRPGALPALRVVVVSGRPVAEAPVKADGTFSISGVPAGNHRIAIEGIPGVYLKSASMGGEDILNAGLRLTGKAGPAPVPEPELNLTAAFTIADIDVTVTDATDRPVPGALAALVPDAPARNQPGLYRGAQAGPDGHARFVNVPPGDYKLFAWQSFDGNAWQDPDILKTYESRGQPLRVGPTGTATQTKLIPLWE